MGFRAALVLKAATEAQQARRAADRYRPWPSDLDVVQLEADSDSLAARAPAVAAAVESAQFPSPGWASAAAEADEFVDQAGGNTAAWQTVANTLAVRAGVTPPFGDVVSNFFGQLGSTVKLVVVLVIVALAALLAVLVWRASRGGATAVIA